MDVKGFEAWRMWSAIYGENCFESGQPGSSHFSNMDQQSPVIRNPFGIPEDVVPAESPFADDEEPVALADAPLAPTASMHKMHDMCFEQRVFYRLISGLHAAISAHIAANYPMYAPH